MAKIAEIGVPALVLVMAIVITEYAGAAAMTTTLAALDEMVENYHLPSEND